jgi:hypothetical protein
MFWYFIALILIIRIIVAIGSRLDFNSLRSGFMINRKYLQGLFTSNYIDTKVLFTMRFNQVPCITVITQIDVTAAYAFVIQKAGAETLNIYQSNQFDHNEGRSFFNMTIVELRNNRMVELGSNYVEVYYTPADHDWARTLIGDLAAFRIEAELAADKAPTIIGFARAMELN